jgi:hypothetical protein
MESKLACEPLSLVPRYSSDRKMMCGPGYRVQYVLYSVLKAGGCSKFPLRHILWHLNNNGSLAAVCQLKECLANRSAGGRPL